MQDSTVYTNADEITNVEKQPTENQQQNTDTQEEIKPVENQEFAGVEDPSLKHGSFDTLTLEQAIEKIKELESQSIPIIPKPNTIISPYDLRDQKLSELHNKLSELIALQSKSIPDWTEKKQKARDEEVDKAKAVVNRMLAELGSLQV